MGSSEIDEESHNCSGLNVTTNSADKNNSHLASPSSILIGTSNAVTITSLSSSRYSSKLSLHDTSRSSTQSNSQIEEDLDSLSIVVPLNHSAAHHRVAVRPNKRRAPRRIHNRAPQLPNNVLPSTPELNEDYISHFENTTHDFSHTDGTSISTSNIVQTVTTTSTINTGTSTTNEHVARTSQIISKESNLSSTEYIVKSTTKRLREHQSTSATLSVDFDTPISIAAHSSSVRLQLSPKLNRSQSNDERNFNIRLPTNQQCDSDTDAESSLPFHVSPPIVSTLVHVNQHEVTEAVNSNTTYERLLVHADDDVDCRTDRSFFDRLFPRRSNKKKTKESKKDTDDVVHNKSVEGGDTTPSTPTISLRQRVPPLDIPISPMLPPKRSTPIIKSHSFKFAPFASDKSVCSSSSSSTATSPELGQAHRPKAASLDSVKHLPTNVQPENDIYSRSNALLAPTKPKKPDHLHRAVVNVTATKPTSITHIQLDEPVSWKLPPRIIDEQSRPKTVRKFSKDDEDIEIVEKNGNGDTTPTTEGGMLLPVASNRYTKNPNNYRRKGGNTGSGSTSSLVLLAESRSFSLDSLKDCATDNIAVPEETPVPVATSSVVLRRRHLPSSSSVGGVSKSSEDEPELLKVFARRSLKLKDSEEEVITELKEDGSVSSKSESHDRENSATPVSPHNLVTDEPINLQRSTNASNTTKLRPMSTSSFLPSAVHLQSNTHHPMGVIKRIAQNHEAISSAVTTSDSSNWVLMEKNNNINNSSNSFGSPTSGSNVMLLAVEQEQQKHEIDFDIDTKQLESSTDEDVEVGGDKDAAGSGRIMVDIISVESSDRKNFSQRKAEWERRAQEAQALKKATVP